MNTSFATWGVAALSSRHQAHAAKGWDLAAMNSGMARRAQSDQVFFRVSSRVAAELQVVHLKIRHRATELTPPSVAMQDLLT
jgi:hypothetical protein